MRASVTSPGRGEIGMGDKKGITYGVRGYVSQRQYVIVQKQNGFDVNEYRGYDHGTYFVLYPRRRIVPSVVPLEKHKVNIQETKREF